MEKRRNISFKSTVEVLDSPAFAETSSVLKPIFENECSKLTRTTYFQIVQKGLVLNGSERRAEMQIALTGSRKFY